LWTGWLDSLHPGLYLPPVKILAAFVVLSASALAQFSGKTLADGAVCPLSETQTKNSIDAFSKIASVISKENRCLGCHGRVNPFIDGTGSDPENAEAPPSEFEHGPGKVDRKTDCNDCHSKMAHRTRDDSESVWMTAPDFLSFVGKKPATICKQIRANLPTGKDFLGHIKDDNGGNNFAGTAFNGDRGLNRGIEDGTIIFTEEEVPTEKPAIKPAEFIKLGREWLDTTGGEFKGDQSCGCEPAHYAIRMSVLNQTNMGPLQRTSVMQTLDVPILFEDDGTFSGDSTARFQAAGTVAPCSGQANSMLAFHVSGQATQTSEKQSMHFQIENSSPTVTDSSVQCPVIGGMNSRNTTQQKVKLPFDFKGNIGEAFDYHMPGIPGFTSTMHLEIVTRKDAH
jgi:hypothetical protein